MDTVFVEMFLDDNNDIDLELAQALYRESPPSSVQLVDLIDQLNKKQELNKLILLQTLLYCMLPYNAELLPLLARIHSFILIIGIINQGDKLILNQIQIEPVYYNPELWQETLSLLSIACQKAPKDNLKLLLHSLPDVQREKIYEHLLTTVEANEALYLCLLDFALELSPQTLPGIEKNAHMKTLATSLLLSSSAPTSKDFRLAMIFSNEELIRLMTQLQALAITETSAASCSTQSSNAFYLKKHEGLINILVSRATKNKANYQAFITRYPYLANTVMTRRLLNPANTADHTKKLITEALEEHPYYDWNDAIFKAAIFKNCLSVFEKIPPTELVGWFVKYNQCHQAGEVITLLNKLYESRINAETVLSCISAIDNADKTFTILFLIENTHQDYELIQGCLARLSLDELIDFAELLLTTKQRTQADFNSLPGQFYIALQNQLINSAETNPWLLQLSRKLPLLPKKIQLDLIASLFTDFEKKPQLYFQWLTLLSDLLVHNDINRQAMSASNRVATSIDEEMGNQAKHRTELANLLLTHCQSGLNLLTIPQQRQVLGKLSPDRFLSLYLMVINEKKPNQIESLISHLQSLQGQDLIYYLIENTPLIDAVFLNSLATSIDDNKLLTLIASLLGKVKIAHEYSASLEQLFEIFCTRLKTFNNPGDPIHEWPNFTNDSNTLTQDWAYHLLKNPKCFFQLTEARSGSFAERASSALQSLAAVFSKSVKVPHDYASDLELRANRVLNLVQLSPAQADQLALGLLSCFRTTPEKLRLLFSSLEKGQTSLNTNGQKNYTLLKQSCWHLFRPQQHYDAFLASALLSQTPPTATDFDPVLLKLANDLGKQGDVNLGAHYLAQTTTNQFDAIETTTLAALLSGSMQIETIGNWHKVRDYLSTQTSKETIKFICGLIAHTSQIKNNPVLTDQVWFFITQLDRFNDLLTGFNEAVVFWLTREAKPHHVVEDFPEWLTLLLKNKRFDSINPGGLFALLPDNPSLLARVYKQPDLFDYLVPLFLQLTLENNKQTHFEPLLDRLTNESDEAKIQFISSAQLSIEPDRMDVNDLIFINQVLHRLRPLNPHSRDNINLVMAHFHLIARFTHSQRQTSKENTEVFRQLQELTIGTILWLSNTHQEWMVNLLQSDLLTEIILDWLRDRDNEEFGRIPFGKMILENPALTLANPLQVHPDYQEFLKELLLAPPIVLDRDHFIQHFNRLTPQNQCALSETILGDQALCEANLTVLQPVSRVLSIQTLYNLHEKNKNRHFIIELLFNHPQGLDQLSNQQMDHLLEQLTTGRQLFSILNSYNSPEIKCKFISNLYNYLRRNAISLSSWLESMSINRQTLVALANFTSLEQDKDELGLLINKASFRQKEIQSWLQNPDMDMAIETNSLLFAFLVHASLNPWQGWHCSPDLLRYLDEKNQKLTSQASFQLLNEIYHLEALFTPLNNSEEVITQTLNAARWIYRLPVLAAAVPEIFSVYNQLLPDIQSNLAQTNLFVRVIQPLINKEKDRNAPAPQLNNLNLLLESYLESLKGIHRQCQITNNARTRKTKSAREEEQLSLLQNHLTSLHRVLSRFKQKQETLVHFTAEGLAGLFNNDSYFAKAENATPIQWSKQQIRLFSTAQEEHQKWLVTHFPLQQQLDALILALKKNELLIKDKSFRNWILEHVLLSRPADKLEHGVLKSILTNYPPQELNTELKLIKNTLNECQQTFDTITKIQAHNLHALVDYLFNSQLNELEQHQQAFIFIKQPQLTALYDFVIKAKKAGLNHFQIQSLIPDERLNKNFEMEWINLEIANIRPLSLRLHQRLHELTEAGLGYCKDGFDYMRLANIPRSLLIGGNEHQELSRCINSYQNAFLDKKNPALCKQLLDILDQFNFSKSKTNAFFSSLTPELIDAVLALATEDTLRYESLIEKLILAGYKNRVQLALEQCLTGILNKTSKISKKVKSLDELSFVQWAGLTETELHHCLSIQRLLYCIQPIPELENWSRENPGDSKAYFCAEASLIYSLSECNKPQNDQAIEPTEVERGKINLGKALDFLQSHSKWLFYQSTLTEIQTQINIKKPAVFYHYLCSSFFFTGKTELLIEQFISWITQLNQVEPDDPYLIKILHIILDAEACSQLCKSASNLKPEALYWLIKQIIAWQGEAAILQQEVIANLPWQCIQQLMISRKANPLTLMTLVLHSEQHRITILTSKQKQLEFHNLLKQMNFSTNELIYLEKNHPDSNIRSLLSAQILCSEDYASRLSSAPFQGKENKNRERQNIRLLPLINRLNIHMLPQEVLNDLIPEAKASLFCSIKHFHQLGERLKTLLPEKEAMACDLIDYWLNHYLLMPNADELLLELIKHFPQQLLSCARRLDRQIHHHLLKIVLKNIHCLPLIDLSYLDNLFYQYDEGLLQYIIELLLADRQENMILMQLLQTMLITIVKDKPALELMTRQLLLRLDETVRCETINSLLAQVRRDHIRQSALAGDCSVFYDRGLFNLDRAKKTIQIAEQEPSEPKPGFRQQITGLIDSLIANEEKKHEPEQSISDIKSIDSFICSYRGDSSHLTTLINDYLLRLANKKHHKNKAIPLHSTASLLNSLDLQIDLRHLLFNCILSKHELFDARICAELIRYNAQDAIGYYGQSRRYAELIRLCDYAVTGLTNQAQPHLVTLVQAARQEAIFEQSMGRISGFCSGLRRWFKRCLYYGWSFKTFGLNQPQFVAPYTDQALPITPSFAVINEGLVHQIAMEEELPTLLSSYHSRSAVSMLNRLTDAIHHYELEMHSGSELATRQQIDRCYTGLFERAIHEPDIDTWFCQHQAIFIENRKHLIGLYCKSGSTEQLNLLLSKIPNDAGLFSTIAQELNQNRPIEQTHANTSSASEFPLVQNLSSTSTTFLRNSQKNVVGGYFWLRKKVIYPIMDVLEPLAMAASSSNKNKELPVGRPASR